MDAVGLGLTAVELSAAFGVAGYREVRAFGRSNVTFRGPRATVAHERAFWLPPTLELRFSQIRICRASDVGTVRRQP